MVASSSSKYVMYSRRLTQHTTHTHAKYPDCECLTPTQCRATEDWKIQEKEVGLLVSLHAKYILIVNSSPCHFIVVNVDEEKIERL